MTPLNRMPSAVRGVAALTLVMVLFFVMAMVAAYTNRNLLYEQRMSINDFRATAAFSAADAGVDWAIAMLGGSRVDANCIAQDAPGAGDLDFRSRYTILQADGSYSAPTWGAGAETFFRPSCVMRDGNWSCKCPDAANPTPALDYPASSAPIFQIEVRPEELPIGRPGVLRVDAWGSHESSREMSFEKFGNYNRIRVHLGLVRALPVPPVAALTAGNTIMVNGATELRVSNTDNSTGVALHAGNGIASDPSHTTLLGPAGSLADAAQLRIDTDVALKALSANEALFRSLFGMDAATFSRQPGAAFVDCGGGCTGAGIAALAAKAPGRVLWIDGSLDLDAAGTLGTVTRPVMIVASRDVTVSAPVVINGFVYARDLHWQAGAAGGAVRGALFASRDFVANGDVAVAYDGDILQQISRSYGSFVKVPGSWRVITTQ